MAERPEVTQASGSHPHSASINTVALGTSEEQVVFVNNTGATVEATAFSYYPDAAVSGATPDNFKLQMFARGTAGTPQVAASTVANFVASKDIAIFDGNDFTLVGTQASLQLANGGCFTISKTEGGSGLALPGGQVAVSYKFV